MWHFLERPEDRERQQFLPTTRVWESTLLLMTNHILDHLRPECVEQREKNSLCQYCE